MHDNVKPQCGRIICVGEQIGQLMDHGNEQFRFRYKGTLSEDTGLTVIRQCGQVRRRRRSRDGEGHSRLTL